MRIVRVEIERFMGLRDVALEIAPSLQLVAGPNNSGKTSLLRALEFFSNPDAALVERIKPQNDYYSKEGPRALTKVRVYFGELTSHELKMFEKAILKQSGRFWVEVRMSRTGKLSFEASKGEVGRDIHQLVLDRLDIVHVPAVRVDRGQPGAPDTERLAATVRDVLVRTRPGPANAAQRKFASRARALTKILGAVLEQSKAPISQLVFPGVDLEFRMPEGAALLDAALARVELRPRSGTDIELRDEGTGIQSLLSLGILQYAATRDRARTHLFLVEEPEAFLHPQLQRAVSKHLEALSARAQVVATTHSSVIVDATDLRKVCRLKRDPEGLRYCWKAAVMDDAIAGQLSRYCDAKNSELVFARKVVFCEGPSDAGAIEALLGADLRGGDVAVVSMGSADNAADFVRLARHFQIPFLVVLDKDKLVGDRTAVRKAATAAGSPFSSVETQDLANLSQGTCKNMKQASKWRHDASALLGSRGLYCLGTDIEGAIAFSYSKPALLDWLGPQRSAHLNADNVNELKSLSGSRFRERLRQLVGSKGWNTVTPGSHKLKQHVPRAVIAGMGRPRKGSDLDALAKVVRGFLDAAVEDS